MQLAIIADTHMAGTGPRQLPDRCVELVAASDLVVHAGDIMTPEALIEIEAIGPPVRAVSGNMDGWDLRNRLPEVDEIEVEGARLAVLHDAGPAAGRLERMRRRFPGADAVVFGHSHMPLHERDGGFQASAEGAKHRTLGAAKPQIFQIFNPGSPTERRRAPTHSMGLARAQDGRLEFELVVL